MKSTLRLPILLSTFILPLSVQADENRFSGHRLGIGFANTVEVYNGTTYHGDSGLHLEYGYDFNHIVGLQVNRDTSGSNLGYGFNLDTVTWKVGADIGYAFNFTGWDLKPYGAIGLQHSNIDYSYKNQSHDTSSTSPYIGLGVRAHLDSGIYFDAKTNGFQVDSPYDTDIGQASLSVGYKF
ncbi:TPA: porin family protein [Vibrio vulnificus]|nr:porin family protein [Vibrio vulnificus]